jgi:transposase
MITRRKRYDNEFRREAVRLADEPGANDRDVERDLGLYQGAIGKWRKELKEDPVHAFPGHGRMKPEQEEIRRLRRENERLRRERNILKNVPEMSPFPLIVETL